jgi:hypothetical protein
MAPAVNLPPGVNDAGRKFATAVSAVHLELPIEMALFSFLQEMSEKSHWKLYGIFFVYSRPTSRGQEESTVVKII